MNENELSQLVEKRDFLDNEIRTIKAAQRIEAIGQVRSLMSENGISFHDLGTTSRNLVRTAGILKVRSTVPIKFKDAQTGNTWSGRGLQPVWLKAALKTGKKIDEFRV